MPARIEVARAIGRGNTRDADAHRVDTGAR
jgi:hypothetical protein